MERVLGRRKRFTAAHRRKKILRAEKKKKLDMESFWVCRVLNGQRLLVTQVQPPGETVISLIEEAAKKLNIKTRVLSHFDGGHIRVHVDLRFKGKVIGPRRKLSEFIGCTSECSPFELSYDEFGFWVCREIDGRNYAVTEVHVKYSKCFEALIESLLRGWHCGSEVGTSDVIVKFENTAVGQETKFSEYVYKTSASSPFVLVYGTEEFWVCQECNGEHKSITMMHFHPSERIDEIVEFAIQILTTAKVPSYNVAVKFEGKKVDKSSTAQLYVGKTSRMCPLVLCWEDSFFVCHWANGLKSLIDVKMKSDQNVSALVQKALPRLTSVGVSESEVTVKLEGKEIEKSTKLFHLLNAASESLPLELSWNMKKFWVCRVCSGERFSVTEVEVEESGTIADLKRTAIAALNIKSVEMCVMFEGKCCPSESKLSAYVDRTSKSSPIELSWGMQKCQWKCSSAEVVRLKAEHCIGDLLYSALQKLTVTQLILADDNSARRQINALVHSAVVLYQGKEVSKLSKLVEYVYINHIQVPFELIWDAEPIVPSKFAQMLDSVALWCAEKSTAQESHVESSRYHWHAEWIKALRIFLEEFIETELSKLDEEIEYVIPMLQEQSEATVTNLHQQVFELTFLAHDPDIIDCILRVQDQESSMEKWFAKEYHCCEELDSLANLCSEASSMRKRLKSGKSHSVLNDRGCLLCISLIQFGSRPYMCFLLWRYVLCLNTEQQQLLLVRTRVTAALEAYKYANPLSSPTEILAMRKKLRDNPPPGPPTDYCFYFKDWNNNKMHFLYFINELHFFYRFPNFQNGICDIHDLYAENVKGDRLYFIKCISISRDQHVYLTYLCSHGSDYEIYNWGNAENHRVIKWTDNPEQIEHEMENWSKLKKVGVPCPVFDDRFYFCNKPVMTMRVLRSLNSGDDYQKVGVQMLQILQKMHQIAIHCNIKPDNILADPNTGQYYLIDMDHMVDPGDSRYCFTPYFASQSCCNRTCAEHDLVELGYTLVPVEY